MAQLAVSVLAAVGLTRIPNVQSGAGRALLVVCFAVTLVTESQPQVLITCPPDAPRWVFALRDAPGRGAVVDLLGGDRSVALYYQTIHHRPMALGDVFRLSADTAASAAVVTGAAVRGEYDLLAKTGFGYIVVDASAPRFDLPLFYADQAARIYSLSSARTKPRQKDEG